jgi:adenylyltransferase/sulfurtransferase
MSGLGKTWQGGLVEMNDEQLLRYNRQIMLPQIDVAGQEKLLAARVLIIGLGGLGSPVAMYLAAAGVGHLVLNDFDEVDLSNLQRQIVHRQSSLGQHKVVSASNNLRELNPEVELTLLKEKLDEAALESCIQECDVVVDCSDNFATRFLVNRLCVQHGMPLVSAAAVRFEGQLMVVDSRKAGSACYRCVYDETGDEEQGCTENGVLAPVVGVMGSMQAVEVIKIITGAGNTAVNRLLVFDFLHGDIRSLGLTRDAACPACGDNR